MNEDPIKINWVFYMAYFLVDWDIPTEYEGEDDAE